MRKGQLIRTVIKGYKYHIEYLQKNFQKGSGRSFKDYLNKHYLGCGVCAYISDTLPAPYCMSGYHAKWVRKYIADGFASWGKYPMFAETLEETVELLELRVRILEKELASGDKLHQRVTSKNYLIL